MYYIVLYCTAEYWCLICFVFNLVILFLFSDKNQSVNVASKLKLLNINAAAQLTVSGYEG
jgi:hypothetical protein